MGYSHYAYRPVEIPQAQFNAFVEDAKTILNHLSGVGLHLAGPSGEGEITYSADALAFNGASDCGHSKLNISIPWPSPQARPGVAGIGEPRIKTSSQQTQTVVSNGWFAGDLLLTRICNGDCSYETFAVDRIEEVRSYAAEEVKKTGLVFSCCKTAYRPYDLAVTACLIALKRHVPASRISTDGEEKDWADAKSVCQNLLGYGASYAFIGVDQPGEDGHYLEDEATYVIPTPPPAVVIPIDERSGVKVCNGCGHSILMRNPYKTAVNGIQYCMMGVCPPKRR